jgi:hypothetical protein
VFSTIPWISWHEARAVVGSESVLVFPIYWIRFAAAWNPDLVAGRIILPKRDGVQTQIPVGHWVITVQSLVRLQVSCILSRHQAQLSGEPAYPHYRGPPASMPEWKRVGDRQKTNKSTRMLQLLSSLVVLLNRLIKYTYRYIYFLHAKTSPNSYTFYHSLVLISFLLWIISSILFNAE